MFYCIDVDQHSHIIYIDIHKHPQPTNTDIFFLAKQNMLIVSSKY